MADVIDSSLWLVGDSTMSSLWLADTPDTWSWLADAATSRLWSVDSFGCSIFFSFSKSVRIRWSSAMLLSFSDSFSDSLSAFVVSESIEEEKEL